MKTNIVHYEVLIWIHIINQEVSEKWNITRRWIQILWSQGRINGAIKLGNIWFIPIDRKKPDDARFNFIKAIRNRLRSIGLI